ncbi:unnamed protein product [Toxocara canis]|nr:unnamed protein product [Toxocara canis]
MRKVEQTQESDERQLHRPLEKQKDVAVEIRPPISHSVQLPLDSTQRFDFADESLNLEETQMSEKNLRNELDKIAEATASMPLSQTGEITETEEYSSIAENKTAIDKSMTARETYSTSDEEDAIVHNPQPAKSLAMRSAKKTSKNMRFQPESQVNLQQSQGVNKAKLPPVVQEKAQNRHACIPF